MNITNISIPSVQGTMPTSDTSIDYNKIFGDAIATLSVKVVEKIFGALGKKYKEAKAKIGMYYQVAYQNYLQNVFEAYSKSKTLIYRYEAEPLYDFFESMDVRLLNRRISTESINNLFEINQKLIISGSGGMGKSTLMRHLLLNSIRETSYIPIFVELRSLNDTDNDIIAFIYRSMTIHGFSIDYDFFVDSLNTGSYIFLFDGLDEVTEDKLRIIVNAIQDFSNKYRDNRFIVSTRPMWNCDILNPYTVVDMCGLSKRQSLSLISKIRYDQSRKDKFLKDLDEKLYNKHASFAANPLLLSMMLLTYDEHSCIPEQLTDFYEQAFMTLFNIHDSRKNFSREIFSKLEYGPFKEVFSHFCFQTFFLSHYRFTESMLYDYLENTKKRLKIQFSTKGYFKDLVNLVCMIVYDGLQLRFIHRSFQEYFAAVYVTSLSDDTQVKILRPLLEEPGRYSAFLELLCSLEEKRYYRNVVIPVFEDLMQKFEEHGRSRPWILKKLHPSVCLDITGTGEEVSLSFVCENETFAYHHAIDSLCSSRYSSPLKQHKDKPLNQALIDAFSSVPSHEMDFERLENLGLIDSVIEGSKWWFDQFDVAVEAYRQFMKSHVHNIYDINDLL